MVRAATRRDPAWSGCRAMVRDRVADRLGRHLGDDHPQAVEVGVDRAGRQREREVAVVTGVRRVDRARQAVVGARASRWHSTFVAPGVGGDDDQRGVGPGVRRVLLERARGRGSPARRPARREPTSDVAVGARRRRRPRSPPRAHRPRRRRHAPTRCPRPPVAPCSRAAPLADPSRRGRHRRARSRRRRRGSCAAASAARPSSGPGRSPPDATRSKIAAAARSAPARPASGSPRPCSASALHHAVGGREPERRTAGEHDRVDVLDGARAGRAPRSPRVAGAPPRISTEPTVSGGKQHDGHAGAVAGPVPDLDAGDVGDHVNRPRRRSSVEPPSVAPGTRARTP